MPDDLGDGVDKVPLSERWQIPVVSVDGVSRQFGSRHDLARNHMKKLTISELATIETALDAMYLKLGPNDFRERALAVKALQYVREVPKGQRRVRSDHNAKRVDKRQATLPVFEPIQ